MAVTACEEQAGAVAETVKGEPTEAPAVGELMVTPEEDVELAVVLPETTLMAMLATQEEPALPQDLMWTVCAPVEVVTEAATEVLFTIAV